MYKNNFVISSLSVQYICLGEVYYTGSLMKTGKSHFVEGVKMDLWHKGLNKKKKLA